MANVPSISRTVEDFHGAIRRWSADGLRTAVVPTMGAVHPGHLSLVDAALRHADRVAATLFVNPKQFSPQEDLGTYPRDEAADLASFGAAGVHHVFAPSPDVMYPDGFAMTISMAGAAKAGLEDKVRPHFFSGVATVVAKLLVAASADVAMFGEKDYQQLLVVRQLVRDLGLPTSVVGVPTMREADGLAMSSRNVRLTPKHRSMAPRLNEALVHAADNIRSGAAPSAAASAARRALVKSGFKVDYVVARNANTLGRIDNAGEPVRLLAAVRLGKVRLIDNVPA